MQRDVRAMCLLLLLALTSNAHAVGFSATDTLGSARSLHAAVTLTSGKVLVVGGYGDSVLDSAQSFDPATGLWSPAGAFTGARYWHAMSALSSGKALAIGGHGNTQFGALSSVAIYDSALNAWSSTGSLGTARFAFTATVLPSGQVLVTGGLDTLNHSLKSCELYDPVLGQWTATTAPMGTARFLHTATLLASGKVLVVGGFSDNTGTPVNSAEVYDPMSGTWTATANALATPRGDHAATLLPSGKVLVAGGYGKVTIGAGYNYIPTSLAELYDPAQNSWSSAHAMQDARRAHTATLLPIGLVLVAGGYQNSTALNSAELYDPVSDTWSDAGNLLTAREAHTASLLPTGQVLIAGGSTSAVSGGTALASAELYTADRIFADNFDGTQTKYP